ncbi:DUF1398 family protein [Candidatus Gracilibacteria bacterium]|nr:DUF1398 family protein [Candidatus Gracilibacteria bacterium]
MFTLEQIEVAHAKTKSGADFPQYIREIKELGVTRFQTFVTDCHSVYSGGDGFQIQSGPQYESIKINSTLDVERFKKGLKDNQEGKNNFYEFCTIFAESGIAYWIMDLEDMTCTYYDIYNNSILTEVVPS